MADKPHIPVMLHEVLEAINPTDGEVYVDGTFGAGGYTQAILDRANCQVIAIDRDMNAINDGQAVVKKYKDRLKLFNNKFGNVANVINNKKIDGFVLDIGVSSMQIDQPDRGFSFMRDGPLDMRMGRDSADESAAQLIARMEEEDLANMIYLYGEERQSRRIAKAIVEARSSAPIETTLALAKIVETAVPRKRGDKIHPATRTFQALRIAVNDELGELERALAASINILKPGGRLVVVTFHSLEDRIVKNFLRDHTAKIESVNKYGANDKVETHPFRLITRKTVQATKAESKINPRARSAKLRAAIRTEVAA